MALLPRSAGGPTISAAAVRLLLETSSRRWPEAEQATAALQSLASLGGAEGPVAHAVAADVPRQCFPALFSSMACAALLPPRGARMAEYQTRLLTEHSCTSFRALLSALVAPLCTRLSAQPSSAPAAAPHDSAGLAASIAASRPAALSPGLSPPLLLPLTPLERSSAALRADYDAVRAPSRCLAALVSCSHSLSLHRVTTV